MSSPTPDPRKLMQVLTGFIRGLNDAELRALVAGEATLALAGPKARKPPVEPTPDTASAVEQLQSEHSRESAEAFLADFNRESLRAIIRALDLPSVKTDTLERMRSRVVEATVGYRLRSEAVRGSSSAGSPGVGVETGNRMGRSIGEGTNQVPDSGG